MEVIDMIDTGAAIMTGSRAAFIDIHRAIFAGKTRTARTFIVIVEILAGTAISTGFGQTQIHFIVAQRAQVAGNTLTSELINHVDAGATILTGITLAIVDVFLAHGTSKTARTLAFMRTTRTDRAGTTVLTRIGCTSSQMILATAATIAIGTITLETFGCVATRAMHAGFIGTGYDTILAETTGPAHFTIAFVAALGIFIDAIATVLTGILVGAGVYFELTIGTIETGWTFAGV